MAIAASALTALKFNVTLPKDSIQVIVEKGWITLEGQVDWQYQKIGAENAVKLLLGVKGVLNKITIKPALHPEEVKAKIQSALTRNARLDANDIQVDTEGKTVILHGKVQSLAEKEQAGRTAWSAPGVTDVKNNVVVSG